MNSFISLICILVCVPALLASRARRQIGYGMNGAGLQSTLSGISSGYGYGYNNAVGLSGLGSRAGTGTYLSPLGLGYGGLGYGGYGGMGYGGLGGYGGYGGIGQGYGGYGVGNTGYGLGQGLATGATTGGAGWGSGGAGALPVTSAVIPTVSVATPSAYGRADDGAATLTAGQQQSSSPSGNRLQMQ